jgi:beta-xylosidase
MKCFKISLVLSLVLGFTECAQYTNPIIWEDLADLDVFRVDNVYYYSASTMHYSPGAPILRSYDLVTWEFVGHSVPSLDFAPKYNLSNGQQAYAKGIWASFLKYRPSSKLFYWGGCIESGKTYIYTAPSVTGPWTQASVIDSCYYDAGLLVDDDGTMYVSYGSTTIHVAQLSDDGLSQAKTAVAYTPPDNLYIEGSRFYKRNGAYYILVTHPADAEYVLKSTSGPFGPYERRALLSKITGPVTSGGVPHQGGLVDSPNGDWYYMSFQDAYPGGRVPVLAPIAWSSDGWPTLTLVNGAWGSSYNYTAPANRPPAVKPPTGIDYFNSTTLGPEWEWNHNPVSSAFSLSSSGLVLRTVTTTKDLYQARNTLTHRILGPSSTATIELNYTGMADGDRAGLVLLRDQSAWVGVVRDGTTFKMAFWNNIIMTTSSWTTLHTGTEVKSTAISGGTIFLRLSANIAPQSDKTATFSYSTDAGISFVKVGTFTMGTDWHFFMGYRYGIFNFATKSLGGMVTVCSFEMKP